MYKIDREKSDLVVTKECRELRRLDREDGSSLYLNLRKVYNNLKSKVFDNTSKEDLIKECTVKGTDAVSLSEAIDTLLDIIVFIELDDELDLLDDDMDNEVIEYSDKYAFIDKTDIKDMTAHQLSLLLFKDLGSEVEQTVLSQTTGLKIGLDLLDVFKELYVEANPNSRREVLESEIANMLALVKLDRGGSSLALKNGRLWLYEYINDTRVVEATGFRFLAEVGGDKTKALDILVLESAFKAYKDEVLNGNLPATSNILNLKIMQVIKGIKEIDRESMLSKMKRNR